MTPAASAAALLLAADRAGERLETLPDPLRPTTLAQGYAIQDEFVRQWGAHVAGWKIAATSPGGRATLGVDGPLAGRLFSDRLFGPGDRVPVPATAMGVIEVELAFRLATALEPRAAHRTRDEVAAAVESMHVAVEIPQTRFLRVAAVGMPQVAADNACGGALVLGPALRPDLWRTLDLAAVEGRIGIEGGPMAEGRGANELGHPLEALAWLVQAVNDRGITIAAGEIVSTGSLTPPPALARSAQVLAEARGLGQVRFAVD